MDHNPMGVIAAYNENYSYVLDPDVESNLNLILGLNPKNTPAFKSEALVTYLLLNHSYRRNQNYQKAEHALAKAKYYLTSLPQSTDKAKFTLQFQLSQADNYVFQKKYSQAIQLYLNIISNANQSHYLALVPKAQMGLSNAYYQSGDEKKTAHYLFEG